ncbi:tripartite tricarboxylate transporter TctB family protein [Salibacterium sp. K-3]
MKDLFTIELQFSENHLIFPRIILTILIVLGVLLVLQTIIQKVKSGRLKKWDFTFFEKNYDKLKFYGTIVLLLAYGLSLEALGFVASSIIFMFLITLLFLGHVKGKAILISLINSVATTIIIWFVFGQMFDITLP